MGLCMGLKVKLPLLKGWFQVDGFGKSLLYGLGFIFIASPYVLNTYLIERDVLLKFKHVTYLGSSPPRCLTMVCSSIS